MDLLLELLEPKAAIGYKQELTLSSFRDYLKSHAKNSYAAARTYPWFFDQNWNGDYYLINPKSRLIGKYGTMIGWFLRGAKSWQAWPDISKGFRGRTYLKGGVVSEEQLLEDRGEDSTYVMLPFDRSRMGVSSGKTIEESFTKEPFKDIGTSDDGLCEWLNNLGECVVEAGAQGPLPNFLDGGKTSGELSMKVRQLDKLIKNVGSTKALQFLQTNENSYTPAFVNGARHVMQSYVGDVRRTMHNFMDPIDNGFGMTNPYAFSQKKPVESWTTDPLIAIRRNKYIDLHKAGELK